MDAQEIATMYYQSSGYKTILPGFKEKSIKAIEQLISNGVNCEKIVRAVEFYLECYEDYGEKPFINMDLIFNLKDIKKLLNYHSENENNLLSEDNFYYHRALRNMPSPPRIVMDWEGNPKTIVEKYYLENKKCFTYKDLLNYFYKIHDVGDIYKKEKRDIAATKYIVDNYKDRDSGVNFIDWILYMIDVSKREREYEDKRGLTSILGIQEFEGQALDLLLDKINFEKINGINKVVEKERVVC